MIPSKHKVITYPLTTLITKLDNHHKFYRVKCPFCDPSKSPALSIHSSLDWGYCFRCNIVFKSPNSTSNIDDDSILDIPFSVIDEDIITTPNSVISIPNNYFPIVTNKYLIKRNPNITNWSKYNLYTSQGYDILIPYYSLDNSTLLYYQIRYYTNPRRFYNLKDIQKPLYHPLPLINSSILIIVEGCYDAIALSDILPDINVISLSGKALTEYQISQLHQINYSLLLIFLDDTELSQDLITTNHLKAKIIPNNESEQGDIEERCIRSNKQEFKNIINDLIFTN
jgi:5S rRNA maturation endonuclease (ribonuclease M5)